MSVIRIQKRIFFLIFLSIFAVAISFYFASCKITYAFSCEGEKTFLSISPDPISPGYYEYSKEILIEAQQSMDTVVLYFWAPWCSTCASLDDDIRGGKVRIPKGIRVLKVPYDTEKELKKTYGVVTQHTFVQIDSQGRVLSTWVGGDSTDFLQHL